MRELFFLPSWPPVAPSLLWFALLLIVATVAGEAAWRWLRCPRLVGYLAVGFAFGPGVLGLLDRADLESLNLLLDIAVGVILFELGQRIDLSWLRRNPWLLGTSLAESAAGFAAVFAVLSLLDVPPLVAAVTACVGIATSPAAVLTVAKDLRAQGQVSERLLLLTALNCIYALIAVSMLLAWLHAEYRGGWLTIVAHPTYLIFGSLLLAAALAFLTLALLERLGRRARAQAITVLAMVVLTVALADALKLSVMLTLLAFGIAARALDRHRRFTAISFGDIGVVATIVLFALAGAMLVPSYGAATLAAAAAVIGARFLGKAAGVLALARPAALSMRKANLLALGLMPMSVLATVMLREAAKLYPELGPALSSVILTAVAALEIAGPLATHFALRTAGEATEERP